MYGTDAKFLNRACVCVFLQKPDTKLGWHVELDLVLVGLSLTVAILIFNTLISLRLCTFSFEIKLIGSVVGFTIA